MKRIALSALICFSIFVPLAAADHPGYTSTALPESSDALTNMDFWVNSPLVLNDEIIFFYKGYARKVLIAGDFTGWRPELLMGLKTTNFWQFSWDERLKKGVYHYKLVVDDIWTEDPMNTNFVLDDSGQKISTFTLEDDFIPHLKYPLWVDKDEWIFRFHDEQARQLSLVGNFNNWSPYSHPMKYLGGGDFEIHVRLKPGLCVYAFVRDGKWVPDYNNLHQYREGENTIVSVIYVRTEEERRQMELEKEKKKEKKAVLITH